MAKLVLEVSLPAFKYEAMYYGVAKNLIANSLDGRYVQVPLDAFRRFVTHQGVYGMFEIEFDDTNKLVDIKKLR